MAFTDKEISNDQGQRIGLYHFRWGGKNWYYTSADRRIQYGVNELGDPIYYEPIAISDEGVTLGDDVGMDFSVTLPSTNPVALLFRVTPPSGKVYLKVRRMHLGEADAPLWWAGTVGNLKPKSGAGATLVGRSVMAAMANTGLRLGYTRQCPHALYDNQCRVDPLLWEKPYVVGTIVGNVVNLVTAGAGLDMPAGYFTGGIAKWDVGDTTSDYRMIEEHTAPLSFRLFGRGDGLTPGMSIILLPGCDRDTGATGCGRFANIDNYGGHKYMPGKSPFDGNPVF